MKLLVTVLLAASLTSMTMAAPAEQPTNRSRAKRSLVDPEIEADVKTKLINLRPGNSATIRCRAKGGVDIEHQPYVSFYRQLGDYTHMPMSSGDPGVIVEPVVPTDEDIEDFFGEDDLNDDVIKVVKQLTLGPGAWDSLTKGDNLFYCKVSTLSGTTATSYFVVKKHVPSTPKRYPFYRRRWTVPPRG